MTLYQNGEVDWLALGGGRELSDHVPWHFTVVNVEQNVNTALARHWIWKNLSGRFIMAGILDLRKPSGGRHVAFEDPTEATAFLLSQTLMIGDEYNW